MSVTNAAHASRSSQGGYIDTLSLKSGTYRVFAYIENADGTHSYLPVNLDQQAREKIRSLSSALLNAHDKKREYDRQPVYDIRGADSRGLIKQDNAIVSHDFALNPVTPQIAGQMVATLSTMGRATQLDTIKAQDIWNAFEESVRAGIHGSSVANPVQMPASPQPVPAPSNQSPSSAPPPVPASPQPAPPPPARHQRNPSLPPTSIDLDLAPLPLERPDWYACVSDRLKLRIVSEVHQGRSPLGNIYGAVWNHFETLAEEIKQRNPSARTNAWTLIGREKKRLTKICNAKPSMLLKRTRLKAEAIYNRHKGQENAELVKNEIESFVREDFGRKEELFQRIRQQADAESVAIADWDVEWAKHHYLEDNGRFVEALARWLDNDT